MKTLSELTKKIVSFRDARDWKQFHKPKDMALSLMLEAAEVGELFQWKDDEEIAGAMLELRKDLGRELSDVLYWVALMAHDCGVDLETAFEEKMTENEQKYPVGSARGSKKKYSEV
jgi:NTP pyrophosphatase (non-canonical NTP hydrolase)